jgi:hypothetical protein
VSCESGRFKLATIEEDILENICDAITLKNVGNN